jgi:hypothetical protein
MQKPGFIRAGYLCRGISAARKMRPFRKRKCRLGQGPAWPDDKIVDKVFLNKRVVKRAAGKKRFVINVSQENHGKAVRKAGKKRENAGRKALRPLFVML